MPFIAYENNDSRRPTLDLIEQANQIIAEYQAQGFALTVRQLFYQFVSRDLLRNSQHNYDRLVTVVSNGRLRGLIDWDSIVDLTRPLRTTPHWECASDLVKASAARFAVPKWETQPAYVEVWIEKDALVGIIEPTCIEWDVPLFSCRGYSSLSAAWRAGQRFKSAAEQGRAPVILHLGDHDPSGLDMTRDIKTRLELFSEGPVEVRRIGLNREQIDQYKPPPNPAKITDSRAAKYVEIFGNKSWELDALPPDVLAGLISKQIEALIDWHAWNEQRQRENEMRASLQTIGDAMAERGI